MTEPEILHYPPSATTARQKAFFRLCVDIARENAQKEKERGLQ